MTLYNHDNRNAQYYNHHNITQMQNYRLRNAKNLILDKQLHLFVIIFFQFFGTMFFTYCNLNLAQLKSTASLVELRIMYGFIDFSLSMIMCISYTRQFAGAVYNPAVVVFRMFRKTDRFPLKTGIVYIFSQVSGSLVGAFIALYLDNIDTAPFPTYIAPKLQARHFGTEIVGGFVLTFMVQIVTQKSMTFIHHNRQFYICLPLFYLMARTYSKQSNCINPAFGISFQLTYSIKSKSWEPMAMAYIIILGPVVGALVSVAMFELVLRPLYPIKLEIVQELQAQRQQLKQSAEIKAAQKKAKIRNHWTLNDVITKQPYALIGDQFDNEIHDIVDEDINDQIESDQQEQMKQIQNVFPNPEYTNYQQVNQHKIMQLRLKAKQMQKQYQREVEKFKARQSEVVGDKMSVRESIRCGTEIHIGQRKISHDLSIDGYRNRESQFSQCSGAMNISRYNGSNMGDTIKLTHGLLDKKNDE